MKIANPDGRIETILKGTVRQAHWSNDGKHLVCERLRPRLDTAAGRVEPYENLLPKASIDQKFTLVWGPPMASLSPDGRSLVYHITEGVTRRIGMMNSDGGGVHTLFRREGMDAMNPVWSPDGKSVAFGLGKHFRTPGFPASQIESRLVVSSSAPFLGRESSDSVPPRQRGCAATAQQQCYLA